MSSENNVPEFIKRLQKEREELSTKVDALDDFFETELFAGLSNYQQELLVQQGDAMGEYLSILSLQIDNELQILKDNANANA